jgi:hypothetical protein
MDKDIVAFAFLVDPVLLSGIANCEGLLRCRWITKCVLLKDNNDGYVAIGICHSVCPDLVVGSNGPLSISKIAVEIVDVLVVKKGL